MRFGLQRVNNTGFGEIVMKTLSGLRMSLVRKAWCLALAVLPAASATAAQPIDPLVFAARVQQEVAELRGLPFKQPVPMEKQTPDALGRRMQQEMNEVVPPQIAAHFGKIVQRLGLYRGPELGDFHGLMEMVMTTQAAAYYDTQAKRIYILDEGGNELEQGVIYSHELYHGLQDQHFDLEGYIPDGEKQGPGKLDGDQILARTAVIEGEATYIHTLWAMRSMTGMTPQRFLVAPVIAMQANLGIDQLRGMVGESGARAAAEMDDIPPFILETLVGNYLKGAAFVFAVQEQGWGSVEKLYKEYPPQSTEQILHPEKWVARENPSKITWPDLGKLRALRNWRLLDDDVLGEIQWRIIFGAQGQQAEAAAAAAGWDGDRYAVFKHKDSDQTLLLLRTAWDSEAEATQFAAAYRRALQVKYEAGEEPVLVEQQGTDVFIVEGGRKGDLAALMKVVRQSRRTRG